MRQKRHPRRAIRRLFGECLEPRHLLAAALDLRFTTNGLDAEVPPGPSIPYGASITWNYTVTNAGDVGLTNVSITDDGGTPTNIQDDFAPGATLATPNALGALESTFNLNVSNLVSHPTLPYVYATLPASNSVVVINSRTLQQEGTIPVSSASGRLALSPDGSQLYVAGSVISVIDTQSRTVLRTLSVACNDVVVGPNGTLYALTNSSILQINSLTGQSAGPNVGSSYMVYAGELAISPNRDRLYYADFGLSPGSLYQFDLTVSPPKLLWESPHGGTSGENGQDLAISQDGSFISYACGYGQGGYVIAKYRTSDMAIVGTFNTGAYPRKIAFSADGSTAYTVHTDGVIDVWNTTTFLSAGTINSPGEAYGLVGDSSGSHLFAATNSKLYVYGTGRGGDINLGDVNRNYVLDPGETWSYSAKGTAKSGQQTKTAKVTASDGQNSSISRQDTSSYYGIAWQIDVEGFVQSQDADTPDGPTLRAGTSVALTYTVTNPGLTPLANVTLVDDHGTTNDVSDDVVPTFSSGDTNSNGLLDPGEKWQFAASIMAASGSVVERVTAKGYGLTNDPAIDSDPTCYFGAVSTIELTTKVNGANGNTSPGAELPIGSQATVSYQVANRGNVPLANLTVRDDAGTPVDSQDDFSPTPNLASPITRGTLEATLGYGVSTFLVDPNGPYIYAAATTVNSVAVINTQTLKQEALILVGSGLQGMALSLDGSRLYVAAGSSNSLGVIDTKTRTALPSITLSERPHDVEVGADGRLYVLGDNSIMQINPATGQSAGPNVGSSYMVYSGEMAISPNKDRLYYADYGLSPASLYQFDLTVSPPKLLWESPHGGLSGSNGQNLALSQDGSFISYACGAGQGGYVIAKYRTSDMAILGSFNTGAYPREVAFSPDGTIAYTVHTSGQIDVWDANTFASLGTITASGQSTQIVVDQSGGHLFASFGTELRIYSTGRINDFNVGDVNRNYQLDPGETWLYTATRNVSAGPIESRAAATAKDVLNSTVSGQAATYYSGLNIPVPHDDSFTTKEDTALVVGTDLGVLTNDTDAGGAALTAILGVKPAHGTLTLSTDGTFTYQPDSNYNGADSFTYRASNGQHESAIATVSLTISAVNDPPVGVDDSYSAFQNTTLVVSAKGVLANDADVDSTTLTAVLGTGPSHGTVTLNSNGSFSYFPAKDFVGSDSFTYSPRDASMASISPATVSIVVKLAPSPPTAKDDSFSTDANTKLDISAPGVLSNDTDVNGDSLTAVIAEGPSHGTVTLNANGSFTYTPAANYSGNDSFTYFARDASFLSANPATVSIGVKPATSSNSQLTIREDDSLYIPVSSLLPSSTDTTGNSLSVLLTVGGGPAHGSLTLLPGGETLVYTPNRDFNGDDHFVYYTSDGQQISAAATVFIAVSPVNDAPNFVKGPDLTITDKSGEQAIEKWATETSAGPADESGQEVHFVVVSNSNAALFAVPPTIDSTGKLTFTPIVAVTGTAEIKIALSDNGGTDLGGHDTSETQTFHLNVSWAQPFHNRATAADVNGDGKVVADDAMRVINQINSVGSGPLTSRSPLGLEGEAGTAQYYDVTGDDYLAADDVIAVINWINAQGQTPVVNGEATSAAGSSDGDALLLVAMDVALQGRRKK